ncbi:MAG: hypothetical protein OYG31_02135 [Candidatus Kaiserbacteria bacterium]|nr:hypothetical protein [Candidatus Kaiserbacteria bacterium]
MKEFFLKISNRFLQKRTWNGPGEYMDSQEFFNDVREAMEEGAKDQDKFMKSVGAKWD